MERLKELVQARRLLFGIGFGVSVTVIGVFVWRMVGPGRHRLVFRPAPPVSIHERAVGLLLGTAVGDAKGLPYETLTREEIARAPVSGADQPFAPFFEAGQKYAAFPVGSPPGRYSDDTQADKFDMQSLVEAHIAAYDERTNGWGSGTKMAVQRLKEGVPPTQSGTKETSGNGVLIKLAPLCFWYALRGIPAQQVSIEVEALTRLTHDNAFSVVMALVHARSLVRAFVNGSNNADFYQSPAARQRFLADAVKDAEELERQFSLPEAQRISPRLSNLLRNVNDLTDTRLLEISSGAHSLTMVFGLFASRAPSFTSVMKAAIIGGDTDSNAAMLGALIGGIRGVRFVPLHYVEAVENGAELVDLAGRFALLFMK